MNETLIGDQEIIRALEYRIEILEIKAGLRMPDDKAGLAPDTTAVGESDFPKSRFVKMMKALDNAENKLSYAMRDRQTDVVTECIENSIESIQDVRELLAGARLSRNVIDPVNE